MEKPTSARSDVPFGKQQGTVASIYLREKSNLLLLNWRWRGTWYREKSYADVARQILYSIEDLDTTTFRANMPLC